MASSLSDTESVDTLGLVPSSPYTASLQPLKGQGQEPPKAAMLASDALMEQFERSQQYVARHPEDFSLERLSSLQASRPCRPLASTSILLYTFFNQEDAREGAVLVRDSIMLHTSWSIFPVGTHILAGEDVQARPSVSVHSCLCCPCHG